MKKALSLMIAIAMMTSMLAACGSDDSASDTDTSTTTSTDTSSNSSSSESGSSNVTEFNEGVALGSAVIDRDDQDINWEEEPDGIVAGSTAMITSSTDWVSMQLPGQAAGALDAYQLVYDTLFWSPSGDWTDITGLLVKDYTVSEDGLVWVLNLHEDVYFVNGTNLTAESVTGTFEYLVNLSGFAFPDAWEATGEYQVTIYQNSPCADLPYRLANGNMSIFDPTLCQELGIMVDAAYMAGSGPYYISDYAIGDYVTLTANPNYWNEDRQPHIETVTIKIITNTNTAYNAFAAGESDYLMLSPEYYELCQNNDGITIFKENGASSTVWFNATGFCEYLSNARVREALSMMIDVEQVMLAHTSGYGAVGNNCLNTASAVTYVHDRTYDPDAALAILAEEGIDPSDIKMTAICDVGESGAYVNIQAQLMDLGITLDFVATDLNVVMTAGRAGEWDLWTTLGGLGTQPYYSSQLSNLMGPDAVEKVVNDPEIKETVAGLVTDFTSVTDIDDSYPIINELCEVLDVNYAYLCNWSGSSFFAFSDRIVNAVNDSFSNGWRVYDSWIAE